VTASIHPESSQLRRWDLGHASLDLGANFMWDSTAQWAHDPSDALKESQYKVIPRKLVSVLRIVRAMPLQESEMQVAILVTTVGTQLSNTARTFFGQRFPPRHLGSCNNQMQGFALNEVRYCKVPRRWEQWRRAPGGLGRWATMWTR
jgi:hypothetical protein